MPRLATAVCVVIAAIVMAARVESRGGQAPPQKPATGVILGRVIEATSGAPVRGAIVRVFGGEREDPQGFPAVMTDNDGQFVFGGVPASGFRLFATKFGYADGALGRRRPNPDEPDPEPLVMGDGERRGDVTIRLWKHAAISGTVRDEFGEPAVGVTIHAFPRVFIAGRPKLGANGEESSRTDDRGIYRLSGLIAGDYIVALVRSEAATPASIATQFERVSRSEDRNAMMAMFMDLERAGLNMPRAGDSGSVRVGSSVYSLDSPPIALRDGRMFVYPSQYYGGTDQIATTRAITVASGQEITGIDFAMKPVPAFRVSGQLTDQNGPVGGLPILLTMAGTGDFEIDRLRPANRTITDAAGRFTLLGVTPGEHVLRALKGPGGEGGFGLVEAFSVGDGGAVISTPREIFTSPPPAPRMPTFFATATVGVSNVDVDGVDLVVRNGIRLTGHVEFAGARDQPGPDRLARVRIVIERREGGMMDWEFDMTGKVTADRTFETAELPPGSYLVRAGNLPDGWTLESAMMGGRDVTDVPVDILDKPVAPIVVRFTDKPSALTGTVRTSTATDRLDEAMVLAFPADRARWMDYGGTPRRLQQASISKDGAYSMPGLPPGEYFVAAIRDDFVTDWRNPAFLDQVVVLATRVTIAAGEQKSQTLVMGHVR